MAEAQQKPQTSAVRSIATFILVLAAFGAVYFLGRRQRTHKLDAFARCLSAKQIEMYGLYWCTHCAEQEEMFGSSFRYATYVECGIKGSRAELPACTQAGVTHFPTWQFPGERHEGVLSLQALSQKSGCSLP
jgi:hypothetical protein